VFAADIVELDSVVVDAVEDGQASLLTSSVRLRGPVDSGVGPRELTRTDGLGTTVLPLKRVSETEREVLFPKQ
jgi:hypothetical protein